MKRFSQIVDEATGGEGGGRKVLAVVALAVGKNGMMHQAF